MIAGLEPIRTVGKSARQLQRDRDEFLRRLRSDIAFLRFFGLQGSRYAIPGLPRSIPRFAEQDPRILVSLKGMVIVPDQGILLLDKALSELSGVEVRVVSQVADRKHIIALATKLQAIDFHCLFDTGVVMTDTLERVLTTGRTSITWANCGGLMQRLGDQGIRAYVFPSKTRFTWSTSFDPMRT